MKKLIVFFLLTSLLACQVRNRPTTGTIPGKTTESVVQRDNVQKLNAASIRFRPDTSAKTPRAFQSDRACIIDETFYDECPINPEPGPGGIGGGGGNPLPNTPPDFNPLSGSITVTNPGVVGQDFQFQVVIANQGGNFFPEGSLQTTPGIEIEGVFVNFHILKPGNAQPNNSNLVFQGIFDPRHVDDGSSYLLTGNFILQGATVTPGADHQFAVVVDPGSFVPETNESNNTSFDTEILKILENKPDLVPQTGNDNVKLLPNPVAVGDQFTLGCKIKNTGATFKNSAVKVKYTAAPVGGDDLANPFLLATASHFFPMNNGLGTNAISGDFFENITMKLQPGEYTIMATVDPDNAIAEAAPSGEVNNTAILGTITVLAAPPVIKPDLVIESVSVQDLAPRVLTPDSDDFNSSIFIRNKGAAFSEKFIVTLRVITHPFILGNIIQRDTFQGLGANEGRFISARTDLFQSRPADNFSGTKFDNLAEGMQKVVWKVDNPALITEIHEDNNSITVDSAFEIKAQDIDVIDSLGVEAVLDTVRGTIKTIFKMKCTNNGQYIINEYACRILVSRWGGIGSKEATFESKQGIGTLRSIKPGQVVTLSFTVDGDFVSGLRPIAMIYFLDTNKTLQEGFVRAGGTFEGEKNNRGVFLIKNGIGHSSQ